MKGKVDDLKVRHLDSDPSHPITQEWGHPVHIVASWVSPIHFDNPTLILCLNYILVYDVYINRGRARCIQRPQ